MCRGLLKRARSLIHHKPRGKRQLSIIIQDLGTQAAEGALKSTRRLNLISPKAVPGCRVTSRPV